MASEEADRGEPVGCAQEHGQSPVALGSTALPTAAAGEIPAKIVHWDSRPNLLNEIRDRDSAKSAGSRERL
jgi:hypothetical protein